MSARLGKKVLKTELAKTDEKQTLNEGAHFINSDNFCQSFKRFLTKALPWHWTVFRKRRDGSVDFYLNWDGYNCRFSNLSSEILGTQEKIHNWYFVSLRRHSHGCYSYTPKPITGMTKRKISFAGSFSHLFLIIIHTNRLKVQYYAISKAPLSFVSM